MSKGFKLVYTPDAITDLEKIKAYISEELDSPQAAQKTVNRIAKTASRLKRFPYSGESLDEYVSVKTDYRRLISGNYLVFYRVAQDCVHIIRVIHGSRNYARILFGYVETHENENAEDNESES